MLVAAEEFPLVFHGPREAVLLSTGLAAQRVGDYRVKRMDPATGANLRISDLFPFDRWVAGRYSESADLASDWLSYAVGPAMVFADLWHVARSGSTWRPVLEDFLVLAQAASWNSALNLNVRAQRLHARPYVYGTEAPESLRREPQAAGSFYSGHASGAFLGAVYLSLVYPLRHPGFEHTGLLWAGSLTAAAGVAALRVGAGKHFPSDVIAGAAMGSLVGWTFVRIHRPGGLGLWGWNAAPWVNEDGAAGILAQRRF